MTSVSMDGWKDKFYKGLRALEDRRGRLIRSLSSPVFFNGSTVAEPQRPNTAAVLMGGFAQCERVQQLERSPTRCPSLDSRHTKKHSPPPWQKHVQQPLVPFLVGPGYICTRSKSKCSVNKDRLNQQLSPEQEQQKKFQAEAARQMLTARLQQQISDLNFFLEEERLNHRQTKQRAEQYLRDKLDKVDAQHKEHTKEIRARHKEELSKHKSELDAEFEQYQTNAEDQIRKLSKEVEFLQGAFEAYKSCLQDEMHTKFQTMADKVKADCDKIVEDTTQDLKGELTKDKATDRAEAVKEQRRCLEVLRKEHKKEMDNVVRQYSKEASEMQRLQKASVELGEAQTELQAISTKYNANSDKLASATRTLTDMKVKLMEFEERFQEKVGEVNEKYKLKLQDLMTHNSKLRVQYVNKCHEVLDQQNDTDTRTMQEAKSAKANMESAMKSKNKKDPKSALPPPPQPSELEQSPPKEKVVRPFSAPGTPQEYQAAHLCAGETDHLHKQEEIIRPDNIIPPEDPERERLRQELLASDVKPVTKQDLLDAMNV